MSTRSILPLIAISIVGCGDDGLRVYNDKEGASSAKVAIGEVNEAGVMFDWSDGASFIFVERCPCLPVCPSDNEAAQEENGEFDIVWQLMARDPDPVFTDTDLDFVALPHPLPYASALSVFDTPALALEAGTSYRAYVEKLPEDRNFTSDELGGLEFQVTQFTVDETGTVRVEEIDEDTSCL
jgi:hypothetical protein